MPTETLKHQYIAIEGNIGAGKTTLAQLLSADFSTRLILEGFADNPFLPFFYDNPERYAFPVELFFMTERHKQLQQELTQIQLFNQQIIADYFFIKTLLFAKNNLKDEEYRLFKRLFNILNSHFPSPDLLVYLHRPVDKLLHNIRRRGREYEQSIPALYLEQIQQSYLDFFRADQELPILLIELNDADFVADRKNYHALVDLIQMDYSPGVHRKILNGPL